MGVTLGPDDLVLSSGSVENPPIEVLVEAAVAGGFTGLTLWPAVYPPDPAIGERIRNAGLVVVDMDAAIVWVGPGDPGGPYYEEAPREAVFEAAAALGATGVNTLLVCPGSATREQAVDAMAELADQGASVGVDVYMEFSRNRPIPDPLTSAEVVAATGRANCGLTVDFWHVFYGPGDFADFASIPGYLIGAIQLNDAPAKPPDDLAFATRYLRSVPGEGAMDLVGALRTIRSAGCQAPITLEVFDSGRLEALGPVGFARMLGGATRQVLAEVDG
ncbi:sugar phosphate isomerase/epimerase family protein [Candidatus Poriferisocius sp.]|uniref:sugar phosphate isomerase/epimerase family protein n=1 Tax=Candidatus Poriferisocius sp. TaxID=3101276 RepID=UPI003B02B57D